MNNQSQSYRGRVVLSNRLFKYLAPTLALGRQVPWQCDARQSMKRVPRPAQLGQDNLDANPPFPKAVPGTNGAVSVFCGWRHQGLYDNRITAQHGRKPESAKRLYTAKRMILLLFPCRDSFSLCHKYRRDRFLFPKCFLELKQKTIKTV
jgi:hypothetical protein